MKGDKPQAMDRLMVSLSKEDRRKLNALAEKLGGASLAQTIRYLIRREMRQYDSASL
jgi:hypothetical protein